MLLIIELNNSQLIHVMEPNDRYFHLGFPSSLCMLDVKSLSEDTTIMDLKSLALTTFNVDFDQIGKFLQ